MMVNGKVIELDVPAQIIDGRTLVPLRAVLESLGATVEWVEHLQRIAIVGI